MKLTRRDLGVLLAAAPASAQAPAASDPEHRAAAEQNQRNSQELSKTQVPFSVEPAFLFKV